MVFNKTSALSREDRGAVAGTPKIVWIELTSKCPFDCTFCSRKQDRGQGEHMDWELYRSLIAQLDEPEVIRLNYSGESIHYPRLADAIRLAAATGAFTELVSAFSSASSVIIRGLVDAGLHRLSISWHTADPEQYRRLYRFGSLDALSLRLAELQQYKQRQGARYPEIDFAFVALEENLEQLWAVARRASALGARQLSVHPVIRRRPILYRFPAELDEEGELLPQFEARLFGMAKEVAAAVPGLAITVARPRMAHGGGTGPIATCEQNPWETLHVLADGTVVVCEVQDRIPMGDLKTQTLRDVWHGPAYRKFRGEYQSGANAACSRCPWRRRVLTTPGAVNYLRGWHPAEADPVTWSRRDAALLVNPTPGSRGVRLSGVLPPGPAGQANELSVSHRGRELARAVNATTQPIAVDLALPLRGTDGEISFRAKYPFCPAEQGGADLRRLGFGLTGLAPDYGRTRRQAVRLLLRSLRAIDRLRPARGLVRPRIRPDRRLNQPGISIIIPERQTPELLVRCLDAACASTRAVAEPVQVIVVANGSDPPDYAAVRRSHPGVDWLFRRRPAPFSAAVALGLARARYPWVYLLNSDMLLHQRALAELLPLRKPETFALASRIEMEDGSAVETNWTDLRYHQADAAELIERDPRGAVGPRGCLYAGGGSGLFQAGLLRLLVRRTRAYDPFYWEDAEWGAVAWRHGYRSVYCPASKALHGRRRTIGRFYTEPEIERIFQRNRLLFHLRNLNYPERLYGRLLALDAASWREISRPRVLLSTLRARAELALAPEEASILENRWRLEF